MRQADADPEHVELSAGEGDFEWACFAAQQTTVEAVRALYMPRHGDPWEHSLLMLLQSLPEELLAASSPDLLDSARTLDKQYIPIRYPNGSAL